MNDIFRWFWTGMIFFSIFWYAFLLFWVGAKGGFEIFRMARVLSQPPKNSPLPPGEG